LLKKQETERLLSRIDTAEYIDLVDRSGRMMRPGKWGAIDPELEPILRRGALSP
jgi:hypothetical protein